MLPFRIREDALNWFRDLKSDKSFDIDFDAFYFCFIAGICAKQKKTFATEKTNELVAYFPGKYSSRGNLLIALFLVREFEGLGVSLEERESINNTVGRLVTPYESSRLSDDGVREFNKYSHAGFDVLLEWFDQDRPRSLDTFLCTFKENVDKELEDLSQP